MTQDNEAMLYVASEFGRERSNPVLELTTAVALFGSQAAGKPFGRVDWPAVLEADETAILRGLRAYWKREAERFARDFAMAIHDDALVDRWLADEAGGVAWVRARAEQTWTWAQRG